MLGVTGRESLSVLGEATIEGPEMIEPLSTILSVVPLQIFAHQVAVVRGTHPDLFRRDDPRYAAALSTLVL